MREDIYYPFYFLSQRLGNSGCFLRVKTFSKDAMESNSLTEESLKEDNLSNFRLSDHHSEIHTVVNTAIKAQ